MTTQRTDERDTTDPLTHCASCGSYLPPDAGSLYFCRAGCQERWLDRQVDEPTVGW